MSSEGHVQNYNAKDSAPLLVKTNPSPGGPLYESASESSPFFNEMEGYDSDDENSKLLGKSGSSKAPPKFSCSQYLRSFIPTECSLNCWKTTVKGDTFRIFVISLVMFAAIIMFIITPETRELCEAELGAVSSANDFTIELDPDDYFSRVQVAFSAPDDFGVNATIQVAIQHQKNSGEWLTFDDVWKVKIGTDEIVDAEDNVNYFEVDDKDKEKSEYKDFRLLFTTTSPVPVGMEIEVLQLSGVPEVLIAALILVFVYILIVFELVHRTVAALLGSFVALAFLSVLRYRPSLELVITWIDFETICLLFGMMVMVGIFSTTGFFEWSAIKAFTLAQGDLWKLTTYLCLFTAVVSAFLDNVTTVLLLTPVTIRLCKVLDVPAIPMLLSIVVYSNLGGTATAIGDPPNIIIVNDRRILEFPDEVNFGAFMLHVAPGVIITMIAVYWLLRFLVKHQIVRQPHQGLQQEISIWEKTAKRINPNISEEDRNVHKMLQVHIASLKSQLAETDDSEINPVDISELESKYCIHDYNLFIISCSVLAVVILFFFLHTALEGSIDLSLAWIALIGAMMHLLVGNIHDVDEILEKVELGTLLFFAGLFVLMHALEELGLIEFIAKIVEEVIDQVDGDVAQLAVAVTLIIWVSAIISAFIDNIPFTTTMVPVVVELHVGSLGLPLGPLVWALAMGACFGGNGTLIGASANVVCVCIFFFFFFCLCLCLYFLPLSLFFAFVFSLLFF